MQTKVYRVALLVVNAIGAAIVLIQNAGDLSDPTVEMALAFALINIVITVARQIGDPTTTTFPKGQG